MKTMTYRQMRALEKEAGRHWFAPAEMRWFQTQLDRIVGGFTEPGGVEMTVFLYSNTFEPSTGPSSTDWYFATFNHSTAEVQSSEPFTHQAAALFAARDLIKGAAA